MTDGVEMGPHEAWRTATIADEVRLPADPRYGGTGLAAITPLQYGSFSCEVTDETGRPFGWLAIDAAVNGRSHGGVRLSLDVSLAELRGLARRMTLKFGFLGLPGSGAKAGVVGDPEAAPEQRLARLRRFAGALSPLLQSGCYQPAPDLGTSDVEIDEMLAFVGVRRSRREPTRAQSGFYTSLTVVVGAQVAACHLGRELAGLRTAVQGFGKVGAAVAQDLAERGAQIVAVSTSKGALYHPRGLPVKALVVLARQAGSGFVHQYKEAERIDKEDLLTLPVDLLCPCATSESIHAGNAAQVQARIISAGANCPVTPEAEQILLSRGTLYLPDFVTNCGGVLGGTMAFAGLDLRTLRRFVKEKVAPRIAALIETTWEWGEPLSAVAEQEALERFLTAKQRAEQQSFKNGIFQSGLSLYRRGLVPGFVVKALAPYYFAAVLQ
jgi:glutamate dehydrogenase (NAD(P)+)